MLAQTGRFRCVSPLSFPCGGVMLMVLEYSPFYHVSYVPTNSVLEGKSQVNVRASSETVNSQHTGPAVYCF